MRADRLAAFPVMGVLVLVGVALLLVGLLVLAVTLQAVLSVGLVALGGALFIFPNRLEGFGPRGKAVIPLILVFLGILVYTGWIEV